MKVQNHQQTPDYQQSRQVTFNLQTKQETKSRDDLRSVYRDQTRRN